MISKGRGNPRRELLILQETIEKEIEVIEKEKNAILAFTKESEAYTLLQQEEDISWFNDDQMNFLLSDLEKSIRMLKLLMLLIYTKTKVQRYQKIFK